MSLKKKLLTKPHLKKHYAHRRNLTICGTEEYMAPELMYDEPYSVSVDVFSYGVVLAEILSRKKAETTFLRSPSDAFKMDLSLFEVQQI